MKKILLYLLVILFPINVFASTNTLDRKTLNNNGVNKHFNINESNINNVLNTYAVNASEKIYDFGNILTDEEEKQIYDSFSSFIEKYNTDLVLLTINLPYSYDQMNEDYAADFYDYNDFGLNFKNYSGILLLRNTYEDDPYFNIYMFGDAQLYIDWDRSEEVLDYIYDDFHSANYLSGMDKYMEKINRYYESGIASSRNNYTIDENGALKRIYQTPYILITVIDSIIVFIVMKVLRKKNKMIKTKLVTMNYLDQPSVQFVEKVDNFIGSHTTSYTVSSSSSSGGGGGSSFGSSGGGHSSGGGRHG